MKLFIILSLIINSIYSNNVIEERIPWREGEKLTWAMFKGKPEHVGNFVASTNSGISLSFGVRTIAGEVTVDYTVQSYFYPNRSWYHTEKVNNLILSHEQTHFDISELFARKLRKKFNALPKNRAFNEQAKIVYEKNEKERVALQDEFDEITDHSRNETLELEWEQFIKEQLELYNDWK